VKIPQFTNQLVSRRSDSWVHFSSEISCQVLIQFFHRFIVLGGCLEWLGIGDKVARADNLDAAITDGLDAEGDDPVYLDAGGRVSIVMYISPANDPS
jgi:hypothetical protein